MPLDADRIAAALLEGTKAIIAKELGPLRAEAADLRVKNAALEARLAEVEERGGALVDMKSGLDAVCAKIDGITIPDVSGFVCKNDLPEQPDLSGFATLEHVQSVADTIAGAIAGLPAPKDFGPEIEAVKAAIPAAPDMSGMATKEDLAEIKAAIPEAKDFGPDIEALAQRLSADVAAYKVEAVAGVAEIEKRLAGLPEPDLSGFATKAEVAEVRSAIPTIPDAPDLSGFATKDALAEAVAAIRIPDPIPGRPGDGIASAKQNDDGELILKLTSGETLNVGKVRGADGIGFDDMTAEDGEREFALVFRKNEREVRHVFAKSGFWDRGVWKDGEAYQKGDAVTFGGSVFFAQKATTDKPMTSDAWRMSVKRGRDGVNGKVPEPRPETVKR